MSWSTTILSTPISIAGLEKLINSMAGSTIIPGLLGNGTASIDFSLSKATAIQLNYSDGTYLQTTTSPYKYTPVNNKLITSILLVTTDNGTYDNVTIPLMLGYGYDLHDLNSNKLAVISDPGIWSLFNTNLTWNLKITTAKRMIGTRIKKDFILRGVNLVLVQNNGYLLLDIVTDPTTFLLCSDFLVLFLIYNDLTGNSLKLKYAKKAEMYYKLYDDLFLNAIAICQVDPLFSGTATDNLRMKKQIVW